MKVVDLHPEELIDKLADGELTLVERQRLDAHLAQCQSCRFEISVRADLEQDAPLFEQRPQLTFADHVAQRTQVSPEVLEVAAPRVTHSVRARSRRRWRLVLLAAALVLCAGGATAAVVTGAVPAPAWLPWSAPPKSAQVTAHAADPKLAHKSKPALKVSAPAVTVSNVAPENMAPALTEPEASAAPAVSSKALLAVRPSAPLALAHTAQDPEPSVPAVASAVAAFPVTTDSAPGAAVPNASAPQTDPAASLFADANRARRDGNVDRAVELYHSLQARFPSSSESELSRALLAQLLLDRGDPEQALAGFDHYLAQGAPVLGAEALVGRARALEQMGKTEQALIAWQQVQSRFPGSVHARLAATRLAALGMR